MARLRNPGLAARLWLVFAIVWLVFGAAAAMSIAGLSEVHGMLHGVQRQEAGVRVALELASAVRDQYAHQAHTIILANDTHLGFYTEAQMQVERLSDEMEQRIVTPEDRKRLEAIRHSSAELDRIFRTGILPAVLTQDRAAVEARHHEAQVLVSEIQGHADEIAASFERSMGDADAHAGMVQHETIKRALMLLALALGVAVGLGVWVSRSLSRRVSSLSLAAARVARGDLDTRIESSSTDELGQLAIEFNRMAAALKDHQGRLVESEKLAGIGRLAAGVAHEINNPLAVILGYSKLLGQQAPPTLAEDLAVIQEEAVRCQEIVDGLLELSKVGRVEDSQVRLDEVCTELIRRLQKAGQFAPTDVHVSGSAETRGSPSKLRQVLGNLLKNASDAAGERGLVRVDIEQDANWIKVRIRDSGPGLSEEARAKLFEPFFTTKPNGTGLGLAVSKAIARAHGGDIELETAISGGAAFALRLPRGVLSEVGGG